MRALCLILSVCFAFVLVGCDLQFPDHHGDGKELNDVPNDPRITTASLAQGTIGFAYNHTMTGLGGELPYTWSATGLPANLTIDPNSGEISGTPQTAAIYSVTIYMVEASMLQIVSSRTYQLVINEPVVPLG